jgi:hypothetical protein
MTTARPAPPARGGNLPALKGWGVAKPGKAADFGSVIRRFESSRPSQT